MQLVLDTHVWLDWLVFDGPQHAPLRTWLEEDGGPILLATERMLAEFDRVIRRPHFALSPDRIEHCMRRQRERVLLVAAAPDCRLPCSDPDDQCFIDLAVAHGVDALLSRDKALLRLARHARRRFGIHVLTPEAFLRQHGETGTAQT